MSKPQLEAIGRWGDRAYTCSVYERQLRCNLLTCMRLPYGELDHSFPMDVQRMNGNGPWELLTLVGATPTMHSW